MRKTVVVRRTKEKGKGRGVFALKDFKVGEIVESCPVINVTPTERKHLGKNNFGFLYLPLEKHTKRFVGPRLRIDLQPLLLPQRGLETKF